MATFTLSATLSRPYDDAVEAVRALDEDTTLVEAFDPDAMMGLADHDALHAVATDAKERLTAALAALTQED